MDLHSLVSRVRAEFNEMPGLRLTLPQAQRLWGVDLEMCESVVQTLLDDAFLRPASSGTYVKAA